MANVFKVVDENKDRNVLVVEYTTDGMSRRLNIGFPGMMTKDGIKDHILKHWPVEHFQKLSAAKDKDETKLRSTYLDHDMAVSNEEILEAKD